MAVEIAITELTSGDITGAGVYDKLMTSVQAQVAKEYDAGRIKGPDYSTVYLGAIQNTMATALQFLLTTDKLKAELDILEITKLKEQAEVDLLAQNLANTLSQNAQIVAQTTQITAQTALLTQQTANAVLEGAVLTAQELKIDADTALSTAQELKVDKETLGVVQATLNAIIEGTVLTAQECKLRAEFDVLEQQVLKVIQETGLLNQRKVTEVGQTSATGVDANSVIGKQKALIAKQTDGFDRDAEQKAAKLLVDTWNVRRTTDESQVANANNGLQDANILRAINKILTGVGA